MWLLASVVTHGSTSRSRSFKIFILTPGRHTFIHVHVRVSCAKILRKEERSSLSPTSLRRHHIACLHPGTSTLRVRGCAEGMPTFADKSREQLKARASAATAAGYNQLDDSDSPSQFALRTKNFALARKKVDAAEVIQRRYRSYVNMWRHYGPSAFVGRQPDQIANFGKCFFPCVLRLGRHHRTHP